VTHTNDSDGRYDGRLMKVPKTKFAPGTKRPIFPDVYSYPRLVSEHLGPDFSESNVDPAHFRPTVPIGHIPEVSERNGY